MKNNITIADLAAKVAGLLNTRGGKVNPKNDLLAYRLVVGSLGACVVLTGLAITVLAALGVTVPPSLPAFGGTALGALTGLLAAKGASPNGDGDGNKVYVEKVGTWQAAVPVKGEEKNGQPPKPPQPQ